MAEFMSDRILQVERRLGVAPVEPGSRLANGLSFALTRTSASTMWPSARAQVEVSAMTLDTMPETSGGG